MFIYVHLSKCGYQRDMLLLSCCFKKVALSAKIPVGKACIAVIGIAGATSPCANVFLVHPHSDRQIVRWFCFQKNGPEAFWDVGMSTNLTKSNKHISRWIVHNWDNRYSIHHSDALVTRDGDETAQWPLITDHLMFLWPFLKLKY